MEKGLHPRPTFLPEATQPPWQGHQAAIRQLHLWISEITGWSGSPWAPRTAALTSQPGVGFRNLHQVPSSEQEACGDQRGRGMADPPVRQLEVSEGETEALRETCQGHRAPGLLLSLQALHRGDRCHLPSGHLFIKHKRPAAMNTVGTSNPPVSPGGTEASRGLGPGTTCESRHTPAASQGPGLP